MSEQLSLDQMLMQCDYRMRDGQWCEDRGDSARDQKYYTNAIDNYFRAMFIYKEVYDTLNGLPDTICADGRKREARDAISRMERNVRDCQYERDKDWTLF